MFLKQPESIQSTKANAVEVTIAEGELLATYPAYNPQAKIATNELVKPYSATIFTQMERDKNVGREYPHPPAQHCKKECPRIQINPRNYNTQLEQQFNNNNRPCCSCRYICLFLVNNNNNNF